MNCEICNKEIKINSKRFCSKACYWKYYYKKNREKLLNRSKDWHKKNYIYHLKKKTLEEIKERRRKYYQKNKEKIKKYNHNYYLLNKNKPGYKEIHRKASKKYYLKKKGLI